MAQLLYSRDGLQKHLGAACRHMRLCHPFNGTQFLVDQIQLPYNDLLAKETATLKKEEQREDRYDDLLVADNQLDDQVRSAFRRCEEYYRANPADAALHLIFPDGKFGPIISMNMQQEPDTVEQIALRIEILEKEHQLLPLAKELRERIAASRKAIKAYEDAINQLKRAQAEEDFAKATPRRQYAGGTAVSQTQQQLQERGSKRY